MLRLGVQFPAWLKLVLVMHTCNPSTWEIEAGEWKTEGHPWLCREFPRPVMSFFFSFLFWHSFGRRHTFTSHVQRSEDSTREPVISFPLWVPGILQALRLGGKYLYLLSHITDPKGKSLEGWQSWVSPWNQMDRQAWKMGNLREAQVAQ